MAAATALQDELAEEILRRLPPDDPALLVRAALVCKHSCRLIADPGFRRRFLEFHGAPPMLGFFRNTRSLRATNREIVRFVLDEAVAVPEPPAFPRFVSISSLRLPRANWRRHWRVVDARHGRVLLLRKTPLGNNHLLVWDPITDEKRDLGILPASLYLDNFNAAVFCADAGCTHLDCRHNPFTVVYLSITEEMEMSDHVYSSEAVHWHLPSSMPYTAAHQDDYLDFDPSVLVGNLLYFVLQTNTRILEYNVATREMGVVHLPPGCVSERRIMLMTAEDGCLGFATVHKSKLCLWSKENGSDEDAGWAQRRVIDLNMLLPFRSLLTSPHVVGFANNGIGVIFVHTCAGLFTIDLNSSRVKKVRKASDGSRVFPYMSYCTPALRAAITSTDEGPTMGAASASEA